MAKRGTKSRQVAETRGRLAEHFAALYLSLSGHAILAMRAKTPVGEVDLIVKKGDLLAFVEVKQRQSLHVALDAVPERNWQRISRAAAHWAARHPHYGKLNWRYDLIAVTPWRLPKHYPDFWRP
ncbi:MAG: YraN family protein [Henriciella sp.]|nr:YraN family protein [Henriciella sp.]